MSTTKQKGQYYSLEKLTSSSPEVWTPVACLHKKSFKIANKVINATSDCGPDYIAGFPDSTVSASGYVSFNDPTVVSGSTLFTDANAQTIETWRIAPAGTPATGDLTRTFSGFISDYSEDDSTDTPVGFTISFQVQGYITQTIQA